MPETPEPINWNHVKALFESLEKDIGAVAEGVASLRSEFGTFKVALSETAARVGRIEPIVKTLANDVAELKKDVKEIKTNLHKFNDRLTTVESRAA